MAQLLAAITPATRLLVVNAPNNPTGWTLTEEEQREILAHCCAMGTWILADEVYERLYYEPTRRRGISYAVFCLKKKPHAFHADHILLALF